MSQTLPKNKDAMLSDLPSIWPDETLRDQIAQYVKETNTCVVALDDDPTGTQTVHDIWVVTQWEVDLLRSVLADGEPALYILTNSRSMPLSQAKSVNREIAMNLVEAAKSERRPIVIVSRSDSTLRGHYPGEVEALADALTDSGNAIPKAVCIIPFFPEGGRYTISDIHWVQEGSHLIPAAETPYAQDKVFGYNNSNLPAWIEEKTEGRVPASEVLTISIDALRKGGPSEIANQLEQIAQGRVMIVNAAHYRDLEVFVSGLYQKMNTNVQFLFRTAASFVKVAAGLRDKPFLGVDELIGDHSAGAGLIVCGSHVPRSTAQLNNALELEIVVGVELSVPLILDNINREEAISQAAYRINSALAAKRNALIYTSRDVVKADNQGENLSIAASVSSALMEVVQRVEHEPRYVIGKGGITASDLATNGMGVRAARVLGQVIPGVPAWRLGPGSRWPRMPYIVFPGNVGSEKSIADIIQMLGE